MMTPSRSHEHRTRAVILDPFYHNAVTSCQDHGFCLILGIWNFPWSLGFGNSCTEITRASSPNGGVNIYFAAGTMAMPHGPLPTLIRFNSLRAFTSTTDTSSDAPFAV
jgi:hypothetical protein